MVQNQHVCSTFTLADTITHNLESTHMERTHSYCYKKKRLTPNKVRRCNDPGGNC